MRWRDRELGDLERQLRARRAEPPQTLVDSILRRVETNRPVRRRVPPRIRTAVVLTAAALAALMLTGGSGFAAYGVHELTKTVDVIRVAQHLSAKQPQRVVASTATAFIPASTPTGHQYKVPCGAVSSSPCVASLGSNRSVQEPKTKSVVIKLTVSLNAPSDGTAAVGYSTASVLGTTAGVDYGSASGTLTFGPGQTSAPIALTILTDGDASNKTLNGETFKVHITPVTGVTIGTADATITITGS
jgi:Calx-beta domain-containing protein